jgi:hypothetical protein
MNMYVQWLGVMHEGEPDQASEEPEGGGLLR